MATINEYTYDDEYDTNKRIDKKVSSTDIAELIFNKILLNKNDTNDDLLMVQKNGLALEYVKKQTEEICLAAVKKTGYVLEYVIEQTEEICLAAIKHTKFALKWVKEQTPEICLAAVKQNPDALQYVNINTYNTELVKYIKQMKKIDIKFENYNNFYKILYILINNYHNLNKYNFDKQLFIQAFFELDDENKKIIQEIYLNHMES